ncbi:hypothetical protein HK098_004638 [Nowakowskiella sp. JEL0407]|nr:hypothetical protein HK098_004638 [Nowakowskiella sp. JEL0407]
MKFIKIDVDAINSYPENDVLLPIQCQLSAAMEEAQGSSYTDSNLNNETIDETLNTLNVPLSTSGFTDCDDNESNYQIRKLRALKSLKEGQAIVKYPCGEKPENLIFNPKVWGVLLPTLFPYRVGIFEDIELDETTLHQRCVDLNYKGSVT